MSTLYTTGQAAAVATTWRQRLAPAATVTPAAIRQWARRGHLSPAGLDDRHRPLYSSAALAHAEAATRERALLTASRP
ncbi:MULTISPECIES: MerR family transcriptional regulator [unclassified Streptomyces]|uniref:MerR family transcriptional regulator n=1 Tax=unclassified Streptomyces TaxID=2593676 RepID=UPI0016613095|nr:MULTISPECIES: MerR family transcriptional regulator [unclassified Streptomyces]MBD0707381.1 MerR family transcriptional regulator [Streptomyces sp. CBMA291]MBD0715167.1 MerR family transcriptional regulator [Streptomyces sp. CBMA370]